MQKWKPTRQSNGYEKLLLLARIVWIGMLALSLLMCLVSCKSDTIVVEKIRPDCINSIKTNGQMLECLAQYDEAM